MPDPVRIELLTQIKFADGTRTMPQKEGVVASLKEQYVRDFSSGSFGQLPDSLLAGISEDPAADLTHLTQYNNANIRIGDVAHTEEHINAGSVPWSIDLDDDFLANVDIGLQHLFGILIGDPFSRSHSGVVEASTRIERVSLGDFWRNYYESYRSLSNTIDDIRDKFPRNRPFLAFTTKPRTGWHELDIGALENLVKGVIGAGFDMIEFDTRYLWPKDAEHDQNLVRLINAAYEAGQAQNRLGLFCPNMTMPWRTAEELVNLIRRKCPDDAIAFKVDGSLDGISTIQAIRKTCADIRPIITSYPLLNYSPIGERLGGSTIQKWLALSGADIIYPGGAPRLRAGGEIDRESVRGSQLQYDRIVRKRWPLPSVAGGVHPGEFHALIELLGYDHALFVGGGVALHRGGIIEGAKWASEALDIAAGLAREKDDRIWQQSVDAFSGNRELFETVVPGVASNFEYIRPQELLEIAGVDRFADRPELEPSAPEIEPTKGL